MTMGQHVVIYIQQTMINCEIKWYKDNSKQPSEQNIKI